MLSMQFALAQHASVHIFEDTHFRSKHAPDHDDKTKFCETCLLTKQFSGGFHANGTFIFGSLIESIIANLGIQAFSVFETSFAYHARGPPPLLS